MDNSQKKILVAEDEEMLRDMLVMILEDEDYQVDSASNGEDACKLLQKNSYDVLLTDLFMPKKNGIDLIIKCHEHFPEMKTLLLSGGGKELVAEHGSDKVEFLGEEVNTDMFFKKPYDLAELLSVVDRLLSE